MIYIFYYKHVLQEIHDDAQMFVDEASRLDINQGVLGMSLLKYS